MAAADGCGFARAGLGFGLLLMTAADADALASWFVGTVENRFGGGEGDERLAGDELFVAGCCLALAVTGGARVIFSSSDSASGGIGGATFLWRLSTFARILEVMASSLNMARLKGVIPSCNSQVRSAVSRAVHGTIQAGVVSSRLFRRPRWLHAPAST